MQCEGSSQKATIIGLKEAARGGHELKKQMQTGSRSRENSRKWAMHSRSQETHKLADTLGFRE